MSSLRASLAASAAAVVVVVVVVWLASDMCAPLLARSLAAAVS